MIGRLLAIYGGLRLPERRRLQRLSFKRSMKQLNQSFVMLGELTSGMRRAGLHNKRGKKPQFRMTEKNGAFQRNGKKGGIDWYRYLTTILLPILIPFGIECQIDRPDSIIQEDKAPSHTSHHQQIYF